MVKTNLSCRKLAGFKVIQESGPDVLKKKVLQEMNICRSRSFRDVPSQAWVIILQSMVNNVKIQVCSSRISF